VILEEELEPEPADRLWKSLAELNQQLKLDLPSFTKKQILPGSAGRLKFVNEYDPEKFNSALEKLGPLLPRE
jgi:hypothetical protein